MNRMILCVISEMNRSFQYCMKNDFFVGKVMSLLFNILSRLKRQKDMMVVKLERIDLERFMEGPLWSLQRNSWAPAPLQITFHLFCWIKWGLTLLLHPSASL